MVAGLTDLEEVLGAIVRITPQLVGVDRCAILLFDPQRHEFRTAQMFGPDRERNAIFQRLVLREDDVRNLAHRILEQKLPASSGARPSRRIWRIPSGCGRSSSSPSCAGTRSSGSCSWT